MKAVKFILSLILTAVLLFFLSRPLTIGPGNATVLPPLGDFFCPFTGFWQNAESAQNRPSGQIDIPGLSGRVRILVDERQVPHIFADNMVDAIFAQGYMEARHRLWQMDLLSRVCNGRLAEVMGEQLLEMDQLQRRRGMVYGAENALKSWQSDPESFKFIEAYTAGVNTWIENLPEKDRPIEFKLLNYLPEKWSPLKTAFVKKYMDLTLCFAEDDLEASNALQLFGSETFNKLYPEYNPDQSPVIPADREWTFKPVDFQPKKDSAETLGFFHNKLPPKQRELVGSNNWAVSGTKTASGHPILCNDPHLRLTLPSIWYELQVHTPEANVYGVSIPGIPGITIGFNENVAWGVTNVGQDVLDWYDIKWTDGSKSSYEIDGQVKKVRQVIEQYGVKGKDEPVYDTIKWTDWGPVVYEAEENGWRDLAMHWIGHTAPGPRDLTTFLGLDKAGSYEDYVSALKAYSYPAQNFAFADRQGNIAITVNGSFPLKRPQQGRFVQDGTQSENSWHGFIPKEHVPQVKNPARGFVASANQRSTDPSYPYYYNSTRFDDYRGRFLVDQLGKMDSVTVSDMMKLQNSNYSLFAKEGLTALITNIDSSALTQRQQTVLGKLKRWNYRYDGQLVEPVVFEEWWKTCYEKTFDEVLAHREKMPVLLPENWVLVQLLTTSPGDPFFDRAETSEVENARMIVTSSFASTCDSLADQLVDPEFNWASYKNTAIMHMARIPAFSKMHLDLGGYRQSLNAISAFNGPSWRMIVELGDAVKAWGVFPGGQSGNPGSPYYLTGLEKWSRGEYFELFFMQDETDDRQPISYSIEFN